MNDVIDMEQPQTALQPASGNRALATTPSDLLRLAVEQGADMDKLEKLMALQERWEANQARKAYVEAMSQFKKNSPDIYKDKTVSFTGTSYTHATLGNICEVVIASLAEHGLSHRWNTEQPGGGMVKVSCILTHVMGHSESTSLEAAPDNSGKKNNIQQLSSAVTYLQRYTLLAACGLATKDMPDDDGRGAGKTAEKVRHPLGEKGLDKAIAAIQAGDYTFAYLTDDYALTDEQLQKAKDLLGIKS